MPRLSLIALSGSRGDSNGDGDRPSRSGALRADRGATGGAGGAPWRLGSRGDSGVRDSARAAGSRTADATEGDQMGIEEHGERAVVEEFRSTALARQTEAEEAFV